MWRLLENNGLFIHEWGLVALIVLPHRVLIICYLIAGAICG